MEAESSRPEKTLSTAESHDGECTRCGSVRRVWPVEIPADIALELEWDYSWLCLPCWREMGPFVGGSNRWDYRLDNSDLRDRAARVWDTEAQRIKAAEELSEAAAALARGLNGQGDHEDLLAELVDARIMLWQMELLYSDGMLEEVLDELLDDLEMRVAAWEGDE